MLLLLLCCSSLIGSFLRSVPLQTEHESFGSAFFTTARDTAVKFFGAETSSEGGDDAAHLPFRLLGFTLTKRLESTCVLSCSLTSSRLPPDFLPTSWIPCGLALFIFIPRCCGCRKVVLFFVFYKAALYCLRRLDMLRHFLLSPVTAEGSTSAPPVAMETAEPCGSSGDPRRPQSRPRCSLLSKIFSFRPSGRSQRGRVVSLEAPPAARRHHPSLR